MDEIKKILSPIGLETELFENELQKVIDSDIHIFKEDLNDFIFKNPKRLRPAFVFLFSKILDINDDNVLNIALITEIIHNASLIHDDILDEEKIRRTIPTFFAKYNSKIAVLEGDYLLSKALFILSKTNLEILNIFSKRIESTILGELNQNSNKNKITDEKTYFKKTFNKTSNLFIAGVEALFTLKKTTDKEKKQILDFMENYSIAFQIENDIKDVLKNGSDIKNGNYTLPVIYYYMENKNNDLKDIKKNELEKYIDKSFKIVEKYKNNAIENLKQLKENKYKKALIELTNYTLRSRS